MNIKLAFSTLGCPGWSLGQIIDAAARFGYDGIELRLLDGEVLDPVRDRDAVVTAVSRCRAAGIAVCALDTSCKFNLSDLAERSRQVEAARRWIALAYEVQVNVLRVFGGADALGTDPDLANLWVAESLALVAPDAAAGGVTVALETHDGFSSARRVAAVLDQVASPAIGALWDSHHPYRVGEDAQLVASLLGSRIVHTHAKDARRRPGTEEWDLVMIGEGEVPVAGMISALAGIDYSGWLSVEWEKKWHPELAEPEAALPLHATWLRAALAAAQ